MTTRAGIRAGVVAIVAAAYAVAVVGSVLPASPLKDALRPVTSRVIVPVFEQRWNLFAPDPPRANFHACIAVRYQDATGSRIAGPYDLSSVVRSRSRSRRFAPPRPAYALTAINAAIERWATRSVRAALEENPSNRRLPADFSVSVLGDGWRQLGAFRRYLSAAASGAVPDGARVTAVRGVLVRTPLAPPGRPQTRADPPRLGRALLLSEDLVRLQREDRPRTVTIFDSGWITPAPGVEPLRIRIGQ